MINIYTSPYPALLDTISPAEFDIIIDALSIIALSLLDFYF